MRALVLPVALAAASAASIAPAQPIIFLNTDGILEFPHCYMAEGDPISPPPFPGFECIDEDLYWLDITQPATQSGHSTPTAIRRWSHTAVTGCSDFSILGIETGGEVAVATVDAVFAAYCGNEIDIIGMNAFLPAAGSIGPAAQYTYGEDVGHYIFLYGTPNKEEDEIGFVPADTTWFMGLRLDLADGPHYGWIEFAPNTYNPSAGPTSPRPTHPSRSRARSGPASPM